MTGAPTQLGDVARRFPRTTRALTAIHCALIYRTRERLFPTWFGAPVLILETIGRRSGKRRATPLVYLPHDDGYAVVPANAGAEYAPAWWLNLQARREGFVVLNRHRYRVTPAIAAAPEHELLWNRLRAFAPIDHYQQHTRRALPVVILQPSAAGTPLREPSRTRLRPLTV